MKNQRCLRFFIGSPLKKKLNKISQSVSQANLNWWFISCYLMGFSPEIHTIFNNSKLKMWRNVQCSVFFCIFFFLFYFMNQCLSLFSTIASGMIFVRWIKMSVRYESLFIIFLGLLTSKWVEYSGCHSFINQNPLLTK